jgi:aspartate/methionine/tyrosine aminotransferase
MPPTPLLIRIFCGWRTWTPTCGPPQVALEATHAAIDRDDANSYLPFQGHLALREAACAHVAAITGRSRRAEP